MVRVHVNQEIRNQSRMLLMHIVEKYFDAELWQSFDHEII